VLKKVKAYIKTNELIAPGDTLVLGVSGGADSVALLLVLVELKEELKLGLQAVHVNHCIRGEEALADQHFTEALCKRLQVPLSVYTEDVPALAKQEGLSLEEAGRRARYRAFEELAVKLGATKIAVAHHMDDNAETLLFRMARGTGLKGLAGMAPKRSVSPELALIRPFLSVRRSEIENWLNDCGQPFCTDSTNLEEEYSRNSIRNKVIPVLEEVNSGAVDNICALAWQAEQTEKYLSRQAESLYGDCVEFGKKEAEILVRIPKDAEPVLFERIIRNALFKVAQHEKDITALHIKLLSELCEKQTGSRLSLPYGVTAEKSYDCIVLCRETDLRAEGSTAQLMENTVLDREALLAGEKIEVSLADYGSFFFSLLDAEEKKLNFAKEHYTKYFDYDKMTDNVEVRRARKDDLLALSSTGGTKELKKLFTDCKVPRAERDSLPVIAEGSNVLWVPGLRTGENRRVDETTKHILMIEWRTLW